MYVRKRTTADLTASPLQVFRIGDTEVSGNLAGVFDDTAFADSTVVKVEEDAQGAAGSRAAHAAAPDTPPRTPPPAPRRKSVRAWKPKARE